MKMADSHEGPAVKLYQCFPDGPLPRRAERSLFGTIPLRAYAYCEPMTAASAFGWWVFPPINFDVLWEGKEVLWRLAGEKAWQLADSVIIPGFAEHYSAHAPKSAPPHPPAFLSARRAGGKPSEPGVLQLWTGLTARTSPGWALLVRPPANLARDRNYEAYEGIIETDWWFGPLFSNIRLCRTNFPILFRTEAPLFQLQPIPRVSYSDAHLDAGPVSSGMAGFSEQDWEDYSTAMTLRPDRGSGPGGYKAALNRRRTAGDEKTKAG